MATYSLGLRIPPPLIGGGAMLEIRTTATHKARVMEVSIQTNGVATGTNGPALAVGPAPVAWSGMTVLCVVSNLAGTVTRFCDLKIVRIYIDPQGKDCIAVTKMERIPRIENNDSVWYSTTKYEPIHCKILCKDKAYNKIKQKRKDVARMLNATGMPKISEKMMSNRFGKVVVGVDMAKEGTVDRTVVHPNPESLVNSVN